MSFGLVSGFSLPLLYAIGVVFKAICSKRYSEDLYFAKDLRRPLAMYDFLHPAVNGIFSVSTCLQIQICLIIQYLIRFCIIGEEKKFYMIDILKEGALIHFNTVFFYFLANGAFKLLTCTWKKTKATLFHDIDEGCKDEYDNCWRFQARHDGKLSSMAEIVECMHIVIGLASALLFIYCGGAGKLYKDIYTRIIWFCYIVFVTIRWSNKLQRTRIFLSYHESPSSPFFESLVNERVVIICKSAIKSSVSFFNMLFEIDYLVFYHFKWFITGTSFEGPKFCP